MDNADVYQFSHDFEAVTYCKPVRASFKWILQDFSKCLGDIVESPKFRFLQAFWNLEMNVQPFNVRLVRTSLDQSSLKVKYCFSLQDAKGSYHYPQIKEEHFKAGSYFGQWMTLGKDMLNKKEEFLSNDQLRLCCELIPLTVSGHSLITQLSKDSYDKKASVASHCYSTLSKQLKVALKSQNFADVKLMVGDREFPAHKFMLGSRSPIFAAMFNQDMLETRNSVVKISDIEELIMEKLLFYIYTGEVPMLSVDNMLKLYEASEKYSIDELKDVCGQCIASNLSQNNFYEIGTVVVRFNDEILKNALKDYASKNATNLLRTEEWKSFMKESTVLASEILEYVLLNNLNNTSVNTK